MGIPYAEVIGDPISHSKSPPIHKFWLDRLGVYGEYRATRVRPGGLPAYLAERLADPDWRGCNLTMPHKSAVKLLLDRVEDEGTGAINTVVAQGGQLIGFNTDVFGVASIIDEQFKVRKFQVPLVVLGGGGAARAAIRAIRSLLSGPLHVVLRTPAPTSFFTEAQAKLFSFEQGSQAMSGSMLLVNATPLGMSGFGPMPEPILEAVSRIDRDALVLDMVYDPLWTTLLDRAQKAGRNVEDGAELLVQQGRKAFEHFFGSSVPRDLAHEAWVRVRDD